MSLDLSVLDDLEAKVLAEDSLLPDSSYTGLTSNAFKNNKMKHSHKLGFKKFYRNKNGRVDQ